MTNGVWRRVDAQECQCWVKGMSCIAGEHRFGGIVVQTVDD